MTWGEKVLTVYRDGMAHKPESCKERQWVDAALRLKKRQTAERNGNRRVRVA